MLRNDEIEILCLDLLENSWPAYLTTVDANDYPQTRAMFNLRNRSWFPKLIPIFASHNYDFMVLFGTNTSSSKIIDLRQNQATSVYYCDPETWRGVMLSGDIEIVEDTNLKRAIWQDGWERYYPRGIEDPDYTVLCIFPKVIRGVGGSSTYRFEIGD